MSVTKTINTKAEHHCDQGAALARAIRWIVNDKIFASIPLHGNIKWVPKNLVILAVLSSWSDASRMTDRFDKAARLSQRLFGVLAIHTYQGMVRALVTYGPALIACLWRRFQKLMQDISPQHYRIGGWLALAVDGSRFSTPRTLSNEKAFAAKKYGKGKLARSRVKWKNKRRRSKKLSVPVRPQIWLTLIWHMGLKLPWCWKTGPSNASERDHLIDMIKSEEFPENTLFCGDAGFTGYKFWSEILTAGHSFLIRVGANVHLLKDLGHARTQDGIVCLWTDAAARRKQPPIVLRLIEISNEHGNMYLVTNVRSKRSLSDASLRRLYPLRWGIELHFRAMKQTYDRGILKSRNAAHALAELEWSFVALTMIQLLSLREQQKTESPPQDASVSLAIAAIRNAIDTWNEPVTQEARLTSQLRAATKDGYHRRRTKTARYRPNYKDKPTTSGPRIKKASSIQQQRYKALANVA